MVIYLYKLIIIIFLFIIGCSDDNYQNGHNNIINKNQSNKVCSNDSLINLSIDINSIIPYGATKEDIDKISESSKAPFVINLKNAFNDILKNKKKSKYILDSLTSINEYKNDYLKSKFFILSIEDIDFTNVKLEILFKDRANKVFTCILNQIEGEYILNDFSVNNNYSTNDIKAVLKLYENIFKNDKCSF